jgi:hypothetical protein
MDIQIVRAEAIPGNFILVYRDLTLDDGTVLNNVERMPKETLAIRAAEYNLETDDPWALDIVLLERFHRPEVEDTLHPLFAAPTIADALKVMKSRIELARDEHGAPKQMPMRSLFHAADKNESTQGLSDAKGLLLEHADPEVRWPVQFNRDMERKHYRKPTLTLAQRMKQHALATVWDQALAEHNLRHREEV